MSILRNAHVGLSILRVNVPNEGTLSPDIAIGHDGLRTGNQYIWDTSGALHLRGLLRVLTLTDIKQAHNMKTMFYYPPEVCSMKYCCMGVFRKEYFRLLT